MESINFEVKSSKKKLCLNGDETKVIEFNPEDIETRKKFYDASKKVFEKQKEMDIKINKIKETQDVERMFELEVETFDFFKEIVDEIFGEGTTDMITDGDKNLYAVENFIVAITPYFKQISEDKVNKYTNNLKSAGVI